MSTENRAFCLACQLANACRQRFYWEYSTNDGSDLGSTRMLTVLTVSIPKLSLSGDFLFGMHHGRNVSKS